MIKLRILLFSLSQVTILTNIVNLLQTQDNILQRHFTLNENKFILQIAIVRKLFVTRIVIRK